MALQYGFFNSLNHDRVYDAEDFNRLFEGIITDGIFLNVGDRLRVTSDNRDGREVVIGTGKCWLAGTWILNDSPYVLKIPSDIYSSSTEGCAIVAYSDKSTDVRSCGFKAVKSATNEPYTESNTDTYHELILAWINLPQGATHIDPMGILDSIDTNPSAVNGRYVTSPLQTVDFSELSKRLEEDRKRYFETISGDKDITSKDLEAFKLQQEEAFKTWMNKLELDYGSKDLQSIRSDIATLKNEKQKLLISAEISKDEPTGDTKVKETYSGSMTVNTTISKTADSTKITEVMQTGSDPAVTDTYTITKDSSGVTKVVRSEA